MRPGCDLLFEWRQYRSFAAQARRPGGPVAPVPSDSSECRQLPRQTITECGHCADSREHVFRRRVWWPRPTHAGHQRRRPLDGSCDRTGFALAGRGFDLRFSVSGQRRQRGHRIHRQQRKTVHHLRLRRSHARGVFRPGRPAASRRHNGEL